MERTTELFLNRIANGWEITPCSCMCGGRYAWMKPRPSGAMEMVGCVCHTDLEVEAKNEAH